MYFNFIKILKIILNLMTLRLYSEIGRTIEGEIAVKKCLSYF